MTREDIKAGDVLLLSNTNSFVIIQVCNTYYLMRQQTFCAITRLKDMCNEDLSTINGMSDIIEIRRNNKVIWTKPIEMTIAEIEKALGITPGSLRIKD